MALPGHGVAHSGPTGDLHTVGQAGEDAGDDGLLRRVLAQPQPAVLAPAQCEHSARVLQTDGVVLTCQDNSQQSALRTLTAGLTYGHLLPCQGRQVLAVLRHEEGETLGDR